MNDLLSKWPDLIVTFLGVLGGGIIAAWIARWQFFSQSTYDKRKQEEIVQTLINRCKIELRDNKHTLKLQLIDVMNMSQKPHRELYEWIEAIASSFKRVAYNDLCSLGLNHVLPKRIEGCLYTSYEMLEGLQHMIKSASAGFNYNSIYGAVDVNLPFKNIKTYSNTVFSHLEYSVEEIYKYTDTNPKHKRLAE